MGIFDAEQERCRREMEELEAEIVAGWREGINIREQQPANCDEDTEGQY